MIFFKCDKKMQLLNLLKQRYGSRTMNFMSISIFRHEEKQNYKLWKWKSVSHGLVYKTNIHPAKPYIVTIQFNILTSLAYFRWCKEYIYKLSVVSLRLLSKTSLTVPYRFPRTHANAHIKHETFQMRDDMHCYGRVWNTWWVRMNHRSCNRLVLIPRNVKVASVSTHFS